jgi:hypothetical protein
MHDPRFPYTTELALPVIGLESEFRVYVDERERTPEDVWRTPAGFIERPLLKRTNKSSQLPTGGAVYFDGGVLEVVTPVIEVAPQCTARVVRSLWEQIGFVRDELDGWERRTNRRVRLQAFSCHVNISFELPRGQRSAERTIQKLALLLSLVLPAPIIVVGANRRSTAIGVRPRRDRIEITLDFTPDPGLMSAAVALIVGVVREVIGWPSYRIGAAEAHGVPILGGVTPAPHASRKGWAVRAENFPRNPFTGDPDAAEWLTTNGRMMPLRRVALATASAFRDSIRALADPFSYRLLFSVLRGETPSLIDLDDRPAAYDDVGRETRWGSVLPELRNFAALMHDEEAPELPRRRSADVDEKLAPPWSGEQSDRRRAARPERDRRTQSASPSQRLTRSAYEKVFLNLGSGKRLKIGDEVLTPVKVKGWYHSIFRAADGEERMLSIDQLLRYAGSWE